MTQLELKECRTALKNKQAEPICGSRGLSYAESIRTGVQGGPVIARVDQNGSKGRILLVDDEKSISDFVYILLDGEGYEVTTAINGYDGLAVFDHTLPSFDLVITDCQMPDVGGVEFARACLRRHPEVAVLYMSGSGPDEELQKDLTTGRRAFLAKPFFGEDLLRKARQLLASCLERDFDDAPLNVS